MQTRVAVFKLDSALRAILCVFALALAMGMPSSASAQGDKLLLDVIEKEPPNAVDGVPRPKQGLSQQDVRDAFGNPQQVAGPVGKPAITRWEYADFIVIFEGDRVIRSVPKFKPQYPDGALVKQE